MSLATALAIIRRTLPNTPPADSEVEARAVLTDWAVTGELIAVAARAVGYFDNTQIERTEWAIPRKFWKAVEVDRDPRWLRNSLLAEGAGDRLGWARRKASDELLLIGVRVSRADIGRMIAGLPFADQSASVIPTTPPPALAIAKPLKKKPGPKPQIDWGNISASILQELIDAGYRRPLEKKQPILDLLCARAADARGGEEFDTKTIRERAKWIIDRIPER